MSDQKCYILLTKDVILTGSVVYNFPLDTNGIGTTKGEAALDVKTLRTGNAPVYYFKEGLRVSRR